MSEPGDTPCAIHCFRAALRESALLVEVVVNRPLPTPDRNVRIGSSMLANLTGAVRKIRVAALSVRGDDPNHSARVR